MNFEYLETTRLKLNRITPAVLHEVFRTLEKEEIKKIMGFDEGAYAHHLDMHEKGMETNRLSLLYFLLKDKVTGQPLGVCGFHTWNATHGRAELFYSLLADEYKQKGLMTEALECVLAYGFETMQLHRVAALVWRENIPSLKLLEKFGFTFEGTMREDYVVDGKNEDSECYSLLSWEWKNKMLSSG